MKLFLKQKGQDPTRVIVIVKKAQVTSGMVVIASPVRNATGGVIIKRVRTRRAPEITKWTRSASGDTRKAGEAEVGVEDLTMTKKKKMPIVLRAIIITPFRRWNI